MRRIKFPWYYYPFLRDEYASLWSRLAQKLRVAGLEDLPARLDVTPNLNELLLSPDLLCSQTCGYDLAVGLPGPLTLLLTPSFAIPGCEEGTYHSLIVVHQDSPWRSLEQTAGLRFVANDDRSWSGYHCLRHALAQFSTCEFSGGHLASLRWLRSNRADVAAIDRVTWALLELHQPRALDSLRVIGRTAAAPAPPLVTSRSRTDAEVSAVRAVLLELVRAEPELFRPFLIDKFVLFPPDVYDFIADDRFSLGETHSPGEIFSVQLPT